MQGLVGGLDGAAANLERSLIINAAAHSALLPADTTIYGADVVRSGRIGQLYGMDVYPTTVGNAAAARFTALPYQMTQLLLLTEYQMCKGQTPGRIHTV